ncbi:MAG TPA: NPCBM/NEW2 domain-containing protein [Cellvibrio sp.]|nr:NPCBM/NEW2 domain-containing protein [Cellvibrio sp.]
MTDILGQQPLPDRQPPAAGNESAITPDAVTAEPQQAAEASHAEAVSESALDGESGHQASTDTAIESALESTQAKPADADDLSPYTPAAISAAPERRWSKDLLRMLNAYLVAVILLNLSLLFIKGHGSDLGFWQDWIKQLSTSGYDGFNGNYPPVYIHWLYLTGKLYTAMGIPLDLDIFLKFLTQVPVALSHCALTILVFALLVRYKAERNFLHSLMLLTVFNPAILVDGPMWGQVDLIPATILAFAILLGFHARFCYLAIPMFTLSLLTKFQMIAFAPVFGFLFFRAPLKNILGIVLSVALAALVFMPSILAGHFVQAFRLAYIDTLGQYPMTTFNAANLWILLTNNTAADSQILFNVQGGTLLTKVFTAKYFGMLLFVLIALLVFVQGMYRLINRPADNSNRESLAQALFAAMICAVGFFTCLPAMHERYLFPAVVVALLYSAVAQKKLIYPIAISFLSGINMLIVLGVNGSDIWTGLSWIMVAVLALCLLEAVCGEWLFERLKEACQLLYKIPALSFFVGVLAFSVMFNYFYQRSHLLDASLADNQVFLTSLPRTYANQDHGSVKINRSHDNNTLSIANTRYAKGIGTHANSDIQFQLPQDAEELSFMVGLDDESQSADVQFSVWGDNRLLWQSPVITGSETSAPLIKVDVRGISALNLKVNALDSDKSDHADWINTIITTSKKP